MNNKNKAFTLVELIVTIWILMIIWVVWFFSFVSYLKSARDVSRVMEFENIESAMSSYVLKTWFYPTPSESIDILYSGWIVWTQWIFSDELSDMIWYSNNVRDPLTDDFYTYSVKNSKREYSLAWVLEKKQSISFSNQLVDNTYAATVWTVQWTALIGWNYNWEIISVNNGTTNFILALPSIVTSDLSSNNLIDIIDNNKLVYNNFENLPSSYSWSIYDIDADLDFSANNLVVSSWSISKLNESYNQIILLQDLYKAYSWSILWKDISVSKIDSTELFASEPSSRINILACDLINYKLKYFVECAGVDFITFFVVNVLHIDISNLPWNKITAVYQASDWTFLFWTNGWIALYDWTDWVIYTMQDSELVHNQISSITEDNNWDYWIWTNNWISKLDIWDFTDTSDDIWVTYDNSVLVNTHIQYIYTDDNWTVRIWTANGITSYDWDVWTDYTKKTDWLTHDDITAIYTDSFNNVWFWTNSQWVDKYELLTWVVTNYNVWALPDHRVSYIFQGTNNKIWVWTKWWIWMTPDFWNTWNQFTTIDWLSDNNITYLFEDSAWNLWVWTEFWLSKYNGSSWISYLEPELLWNYIHSIYEDAYWNILILSEWWLDTIDSLWNIITW